MSTLKNLSWMLGYQGIRLSLGLLLTAWVARTLGPQRFGDYHTVLAVILWLSSLATLGLQSVAMQRAATDPNPSAVLATAMHWRLRSGVILAFLAGFCSVWWLPSPLPLYWSVALLLLISQAFDVVEYGYINQRNMRPIAGVHTLGLLGTAGFTALGLHWQAGTAWFLMAFGVEHVVVALVYAFLKKQATPGQWSPHPQIAKELFPQAWPVLISTVSYLFYIRMDTVMLRWWSDAEQTGYYAASARLAQLGLFLPPILINTVSPLLAHTWKFEPQRYPHLLQALYSVLGTLGMGMAFALSLIAPWATSFILGSHYAPAAILLVLHAWLMLLLFLRNGMERAYSTQGITASNLYAHATIAWCNLGLNAWLIPLYGAWGAVVASLLAVFVGGFLLPLALPSSRNLARLACKGLLGPILWWQTEVRQELIQWLKPRAR